MNNCLPQHNLYKYVNGYNWVSGSIETKTYGKDATVRECEEK